MPCRVCDDEQTNGNPCFLKCTDYLQLDLVMLKTRNYLTISHQQTYFYSFLLFSAILLMLHFESDLILLHFCPCHYSVLYPLFEN